MKNTALENSVKLSNYRIDISADSKEELDEAIAEHAQEGWREVSRTSSRDGMFHATLRKS